MKKLVLFLVIIISCESNDINVKGEFKDSQISESQALNEFILYKFKERYYWRDRDKINDLLDKNLTESIDPQILFNYLLSERDKKKHFSWIKVNKNNPESTKSPVSNESPVSNGSPVPGQLHLKEIGGKKIGYVLYNKFDQYNAKIFDEFKSMKDSQVDELILDLRYNPGGMEMIAMYIAVSINEKFIGELFDLCKNDLGGIVQKLIFPEDSFSTHHTVKIMKYLNLKRLIVITSHLTASASELLINSLRGVDLPVILVGEKTYGKNVGGFTHEYHSTNYNIKMYLIDHKHYNKKGVSIPDNGLTPDIYVKFNGLNKYNVGSNDEPMLSACLRYIKDHP